MDTGVDDYKFIIDSSWLIIIFLRYFMRNRIDPNKDYTPGEIARQGLILSLHKEKSLRAVDRYIKDGKLKARFIPVGKNKQYLVKGEDILTFLEENPKHSPSKKAAL